MKRNDMNTTNMMTSMKNMIIPIQIEFEGMIYKLLSRPFLSDITRRMKAIEPDLYGRQFMFETILREPIGKDGKDGKDSISEYFLRMKLIY
jgi:hypothetical protein